MAILPVKNITSPLPKFVPLGAGTISMLAVKNLKDPLPKFGPTSGAWVVTGPHIIPVKPLPGTGGGGTGGSVGYPI